MTAYQIVLLPKADYWSWVDAAKAYVAKFDSNLTDDPVAALVVSELPATVREEFTPAVVTLLDPVTRTVVVSATVLVSDVPATCSQDE